MIGKKYISLAFIILIGCSSGGSSDISSSGDVQEPGDSFAKMDLLQDQSVDTGTDSGLSDIPTLDLFSDIFLDQQAEMLDLEDNLEISDVLPHSFDTSSEIVPDIGQELVLDIGPDEGGCLDVYPGQVIITEIMLTPAQSVGPAGRFIELYNTGYEPLTMVGWVIEDAAGQSSAIILDEALPSQAYLVLGFTSDQEANGGLEELVIIQGIDPTAGLLRLVAGPVELDRVEWDPELDWTGGDASSLSLDPEYFGVQENDELTNWCEGQEVYGPGGAGTPGLPNSPCPIVCGDGIQDEGEACDDGNDDPCDGCLPDCTEHENICGDGFICAEEACDDKNTDSCDGCLADCTDHLGFCGDTFVCDNEECDLGIENGGDDCTIECSLPIPPPCPVDMVLITANPESGVANDFCMDRWEASRLDATDTQGGTDVSIAVSKAGVIPWSENPMTVEHLATFGAACEAAGKRLCQPNEWYYSCTGSAGNIYVFGNEFDPNICKSFETSCDVNCIFSTVPTGSFSGCVNEFGAFDVNGNVWEIVPSQEDPRGWEVRGGAFNCGGPQLRLQCTYNAGWNGLYAGFRCCRGTE
jgi:cysteine-rich repeat protein